MLLSWMIGQHYVSVILSLGSHSATEALRLSMELNPQCPQSEDGATR